MIKEECRQEAAPLTLPDLRLSVSYEDALHYAQARLKMLGSGNLKSFCDAQQLTYTNVVGLKNNTLKGPQPRFLHRLLGSLAMPTGLLQYPPGSKTHRFVLSSAEALAAFQEQLTFLKGYE
ncbi:hypothetical protein ACFST9_14445 [Hymenobacter monticola]|uniref:Uncharacterized protein n=1 Tax=Hymenobacter monticola TaxID=1705399 RepID=A0ABY4BG06_9BACT|nr:hypothetical protein [Hymenobacter monticola]UOE36688.1 hypothetical protein MTP16_24685 [Hymenobacter monticola]